MQELWTQGTSQALAHLQPQFQASQTQLAQQRQLCLSQQASLNEQQARWEQDLREKDAELALMAQERDQARQDFEDQEHEVQQQTCMWSLGQQQVFAATSTELTQMPSMLALCAHSINLTPDVSSSFITRMLVMRTSWILICLSECLFTV